MTWLITGARGQVGSEILRLAADCCLAGRGMGRGELAITEPEAVARVVAGASLIINAAAYTDGDRAEDQPDIAFATNRDGPGSIAAACMTHRIPLLHISTDFVFDGREHSVYREADPVSPLNVYGASKAAGEDAVRERLHSHIILRTSWVFSPRGRNFVTSIIAAARTFQMVSVVDDQRGSPTAATDIAAAVLSMAQAVQDSEFDRWGTYHFCGTPAVTRYDFATAVLRDRPDAELRRIKSSAYQTKAARPANVVLDCTRARETFGLTQPSWEIALSAMRAELGP